MTVTPIYAAGLTLLFLALSARVIFYRRENRISVGDKGDRQLIKRMRAQGNCAEYAPMGVLLLLLAELQGTPGWVLHLFGLTLLSGRVLHAVGYSPSPQKPGLRVAGMALTLGMMSAAALWVLGVAVF